MKVRKGVYYDQAELECSCGCCWSDPGWGLDATLVHALDSIRHAMRQPVRVTSGYRCRKHNEAIGGSPNSYHCQGLAADINLVEGDQPDLGLVELYHAVVEVPMIRGIGAYPHHIHVDVRSGPMAFWTVGDPDWYLDTV